MNNLYFKVKEDSKEREHFYKLWHWQDGWRECKEEIKEMLKIDEIDGVVCNPNMLHLKEVPEHLKRQFCKNKNINGNYRARINSQINKQWVEFCKEKELYYYNTMHIDIVLRLCGDKIYRKIGEKNYIEVIKPKEWVKEFYEKRNYLEPVDEVEFLRLRADWLEKNRNKEVTQ